MFLYSLDYIETTTTALYGGITDNVPRLDYTDSSCPALLLEQQRTNLVTQSEYFGAWGKNSVTITSNYSISPEGVINGSLMSRSGSGTLSGSVELTGMPTASDAKVLSVYAKAETHDYIQLFHSGDAQGYVNFNLATGVVGTSGTKSTGDIEPIGNGWYRCSAIWNNTNAFGSVIFVGFASSASAPFAGGSVPQTSSVSIFGGQYETGNYSTSYIPTYGAGSVTRNADACFGAGNAATFNSTEGVLYFEGSAFISNDFKSLSLSNGSVSGGDDNRVMIGFQNNILYANVRVGNVYQFNENLTIPVNNTNKIALKYKQNDFALWVNGNEVKTDNNGTTFSEGILKKIQFADGRPTTSIFKGNVKQVLTFNTALTDAELATLTTI